MKLWTDLKRLWQIGFGKPPATPAGALRPAYDRGWKDFHDGVPLSCNPFPVREDGYTPSARAWEQGWKEHDALETNSW